MPSRFDLKPVVFVKTSIGSICVIWFWVSDDLDGIVTPAGQGKHLTIALVLEDDDPLKVVPVVIPPGSTCPVLIMINMVVIKPIPALFPDSV